VPERNHLMLERTDPFLHGADPLLHGADPLLHGADPLLQGADPLLQGADPLLHGADPLLQGADPLHQGADPLHQGADPLLQGADPLLQGADPLHQGADPLLHGADPLLQGAEPLLDFLEPKFDLRECLVEVPGQRLDHAVEIGFEFRVHGAKDTASPRPRAMVESATGRPGRDDLAAARQPGPWARRVTLTVLRGRPTRHNGTRCAACVELAESVPGSSPALPCPSRYPVEDSMDARSVAPRWKPVPRRRAGLLAIAGTAALMAPADAAAQTIRGVVLEEGTATPIVTAAVEVAGADTTYSAVTNEAGWFQVHLRQPGQYVLRPSHMSYAAAGADTVTLARHEIVTVVVRMGRAAIPLEPLVVATRTFHPLKGFYDRMEHGRRGYFVKRDFIDRRLAVRPSELVSMTPGIRVERPSSVLGSNFTSTITMWGVGGRCVANVFLDGLPVLPGITSIDELTSADQLEGVEIYDSFAAAPEIFYSMFQLHGLDSEGYRRQCGVVAYWSRRDIYQRRHWIRWALGVGLAGMVYLMTRM
jgi:hypothetical protein